MTPDINAWWQQLALRAERRLPALTRFRRPEKLPVLLHRRRIYVLPTGAGYGFGVLLAVMLLGALNYQNNAALLLTCLLGAAVINSMLIAFRALYGLKLLALRAGHAFAGEPLPLHLTVDAGTRARPALRVDLAANAQVVSPGAGIGDAVITVDTTQRGWISLPRMRLSSTLPFGLFRAWSWITPAQRVLVYPRPLAGAPPLPRDADQQLRQRGDEEYSGLRDYRIGDPLKRIAWKASARRDQLLVRELDSAAPVAPNRFEWDMLHGLDRETRISRLAGWVCEAHAAARAWTLVLPDALNLGPAADDAHYHRCLTALAELP